MRFTTLCTLALLVALTQAATYTTTDVVSYSRARYLATSKANQEDPNSIDCSQEAYAEKIRECEEKNKKDDPVGGLIVLMWMCICCCVLPCCVFTCATLAPLGVACVGIVVPIGSILVPSLGCFGAVVAMLLLLVILFLGGLLPIAPILVAFLSVALCGYCVR